MNTIIINKILMHMLDFEHGTVHYSDEFVDLNNTNLDYFHKKLEKTFYNNTLREIVVGPMHEFVLRGQNMIRSDEEFMHQAKEIANQLFALGKKIEDMPNCNLLLVDCYKEGERFIGIIKLNYKEIPVSKVEDGKVRITVSQVLPAMGARIEEAVVMNTETKQLYIIEKKFTIDGRLDYYLNKQWIKGDELLTDRDKYNTMKKVVKKVDEIYAVNDGSTLPLLKKSITDQLEKMEPVKPIEIVKKVLEKDYNASEESEVMLKDMGIGEDDIITEVNIPLIDTCKLVLDEDIILSLPVDEYLNGTHLKKNKNVDGTYTLEIINIKEISVK